MKISDSITCQCSVWVQNKCSVEEPFFSGQIKTKIGDPNSIKVWSHVQGMKQGDRKLFVVPTDLAYGSSGSNFPKIPPNTVLVMDIEILEIEQTPQFIPFLFDQALQESPQPIVTPVPVTNETNVVSSLDHTSLRSHQVTATIIITFSQLN